MKKLKYLFMVLAVVLVTGCFGGEDETSAEASVIGNWKLVKVTDNNGQVTSYGDSASEYIELTENEFNTFTVDEDVITSTNNSFYVTNGTDFYFGTSEFDGIENITEQLDAMDFASSYTVTVSGDTLIFEKNYDNSSTMVKEYEAITAEEMPAQ